MSDLASFEKGFDSIRHPDRAGGSQVPAPTLDYRTESKLKPATALKFDGELKAFGKFNSSQQPAYFMRLCHSVWEHRTGPKGPDGATGPNRTEVISTAVAGADGRFEIREYGAPDLQSAVSKTYVRSMLQQIQANYLNSDYSNVGSQLDWMLRCVGAAISNPDPEYQSFYQTINSLIAQLRLGLDYFGLPQNYVPLLSVTYYLSEVDRLIEHAQAIEDAYRDIYLADTTQEQRLKALGTTQATIESVLALSKNRRDALRTSTTAIQNNIAMMRDQLDQLFFELITADREFQEAVRNQSSGSCSFVDLCMFVASVVAVVYTGGAAAVALAGSAKKIFVDDPKDEQGNSVSGAVDTAKYVVRSLEPAGKSVSEFQAAYAKYKKYMEIPDQPTAPKLPDDQAKLLAIKDDFDKQIAPFLSLPAAQAYKALMHTYIEVAQSRNNKIMELNAIYAEIVSLDGMVSSKQQELIEVRQQVFDSIDPSLPVVRTFLDGASREAKSQVLQVIYFMEKAYQYYTGNQDQISINDRNVELLRSAAASVRARVIDAKRGFGRPPSIFTKKPIVLDPYLTKSAWSQLHSTGVFTFALPADIPEFQDYYLAMVRSVDFQFKGVSSQQRTIKMVHHGKSTLRSSSGVWRDYSHQPVTSLVEIDARGGVVSDGTIAETKDDEYAGVGPFGPWTIGVRLSRPEELKKISSITVLFTGTGFPS